MSIPSFTDWKKLQVQQASDKLCDIPIDELHLRDFEGEKYNRLWQRKRKERSKKEKTQKRNNY